MTRNRVAVCDFEVKGKETDVVWERWLRKEGFTGAAGTGQGVGDGWWWEQRRVSWGG